MPRTPATARTMVPPAAYASVAEAAAFTSLAPRTIRKLIAALPHKLRDALLLAGSGEHTYEQIGVLLGAPVGTVNADGTRISDKSLNCRYSSGKRMS